MFASVANYLFGTGEPEETETQEKTLQPDEGEELHSEGEEKSANDSDWVVVDMQDTHKTTTTPNRGHRDDMVWDINGFSHTLTPPCSDSDCDSSSSLPCHTPSTPGSLSPISHHRCRLRPRFGGRESWILTPPPCFTGSKVSTSQMVDNPLENLLIEHPSMSVYNSQTSMGSSGEGSDLSENSTDSVSMAIRKRNLRPRNAHGNAVSHQPPRQPQAVASRAGLLAQIDSVRATQKACQYKRSRRLSRKNLEHQNKVSHTAAIQHFGKRNPLKAPRTSTVSYQRKH